MPKISGTTPDVVTRTKKYLHGHSATGHLQKEVPRSDGDTGGVSATGTPMLRSVRELMSKRRGSGVQVTQSGRLPSAPDGQIGLRCACAVCPISRRHVSMVWCQGTLGYATAGTNRCSPCRSRWRKPAMGYVQ
ncbi:hypothetical protein TIFTF001_003192 [Ficus carica]|uniref:Uncharacterized protein n=1 Tax=Ficus carica TaxID=3494 RepID=A0AA87ZC57_FICCA|nr:hypothetical protein TIFTF001_003192 [Ficus carica]